MSRRLLPLLAGLLAALSLNAGAAERSASVLFEFTNLGYTLIDLNPGDGLAPSVQFDVTEHSIQASIFDQINPFMEEKITGYGTVNVKNGSGSATSTRSPTSAQVSAQVGGDSPYTRSIGGGSDMTWSLKLSPYTALVYNASGTVTGEASDDSGRWYGLAYMEGRTWEGDHSFSYLNEQSYIDRRDGAFYLSGYLTSGAGTATGFLRVGGGGGAIIDGATLPPVPEPETYVLLSAGVGLLGLLARRRNAAARNAAA